MAEITKESMIELLHYLKSRECRDALVGEDKVCGGWERHRDNEQTLRAIIRIVEAAESIDRAKAAPDIVAARQAFINSIIKASKDFADHVTAIGHGGN